MLWKLTSPSRLPKESFVGDHIKAPSSFKSAFLAAEADTLVGFSGTTCQRDTRRREEEGLPVPTFPVCVNLAMFTHPSKAVGFGSTAAFLTQISKNLPGPASSCPFRDTKDSSTSLSSKL